MDESNTTPVDNPPAMDTIEESHQQIEIISNILVQVQSSVEVSEDVDVQGVPDVLEAGTPNESELPKDVEIINNEVVSLSTEIKEPVLEITQSMTDNSSLNDGIQEASKIPEQGLEIPQTTYPEVVEVPETQAIEIDPLPEPKIPPITDPETQPIEVDPVPEPKIPPITQPIEVDSSETVEPIPNIIPQPQEDSSYTAHILKSLKTGGLGLLSAYDSDDSNASDTESVIEVPTASTYRNQVIEINSDDSSSSDEDCDLQKKRNELEKMIQIDDESEDEEGHKRQPPKCQGELLLDDLPPIEDLHITVPEQDCVELGSVSSVIEQLLLVKTIRGAPLLDIGTVLFLQKGQKVLGEVFDVLGQVADPLYCVRFNSNQQIKEKEINLGDKVYCAPRTEHTQLIILSNLTKIRGSDASWENDVEPPSKYVEYSDDEEEQAARRSRRIRNRNEYRPSEEGDEVVDLTKKPRQQNPNRGRQPRQQGSQQYYQEMHQQQPFNYQTEGNTWHSNFPAEQQFAGSSYGIQGGNYSQNQRQGSFQHNRGNRNFQRNRNYQPRNNYSQQSFSQNQQGFPQHQQGFSQNQQGFPQNNQQQYYQEQAPYYQGGGFQ